MSVDFVTFKVLAEHLGVPERTLRRLVHAYCAVYGALPRISPTSRQRLFPMIAVERLQAAQQMIRDVPGMSTVDALKALRDGVRVPRHVQGAPDDTLLSILAELHTLRADVTDLRSELAEVRALLQLMARQPGWSARPPEGKALGPDASTPTAPPRRSAPPLAAACSRPAGLEPGLTRLLSDLDAGYTLLDVRGDVVLLTPSGQQVRLVDPRMVAALVKQGWITHDGQGFGLTPRPLTEVLPAPET